MCLFILVNHNYKPRVDPKDPNSKLDTSNLTLGMSHLENSQVSEKMHFPGQSKTDLKKKIYKEFSSQKKRKVTLQTMDDAAKERYLQEQEATLDKLRSHKLNLREHLDLLEDKLDDTLVKMKEKKKAENKDTVEEKNRKLEMDEKFKEIKKFQSEANELKEAFTGGSGFDKLKALENVKKEKSKNVKRLEKEIRDLREANQQREAGLKEIEDKNRKENEKLTEELHQARDELKHLEREHEKKAEISKSINAASLLVEKYYRELCKKYKINDVLNISQEESGEVTTYKFKEFDPKRAKTPHKKTVDKRMKNPIWRAMYLLFTQKRE